MANIVFEGIAVIIDTNIYAGNFEREIGAYITGQVGECGVGEKEANEAKKDLTDTIYNWFKKHISFLMDDHGVGRPVALYPTPDYLNDGFMHHYKKGDFESVMDLFIKSLNEPWYAAIKQKNLVNPLKIRHDYPAYQSVGIYFDTTPSEDIMNTIKERAINFIPIYTKLQHEQSKYLNEENKRKLQIEGFRLITYSSSEQPL